MPPGEKFPKNQAEVVATCVDTLSKATVKLVLQ